jgi:hypothetical protein
MNSTVLTNEPGQTTLVNENQDIINTYIFRLGGCTMSSKARDQETALMYLKRMWPDSKIEFVSSKFSHVVEKTVSRNVVQMPVTGKKTSYPKSKKTSSRSALDTRTMEERLEDSLADVFGGAA